MFILATLPPTFQQTVTLAYEGNNERASARTRAHKTLSVKGRVVKKKQVNQCEHWITCFFFSTLFTLDR